MRCSAISASRRQTEKAARKWVSVERHRKSQMLIYQAKGICCYAKKLLETGEHAPKEVVRFLENVLFTTLTNVNFDADVHVELLKVSQNIKEELREQTETEINRPAAVYNLPETKSEMLKDAPMAGIMYDKELDEDIRSLRQKLGECGKLIETVRGIGYRIGGSE